MNIKRSLIGFFMLTVIAFFSGCGWAEDYIFDCQTLYETVEGVEIHYIDKDYEIEQVYILEEDEIPTFLEEFCGLSFQTSMPPHDPFYYTVKLLYEDGSFDLISATGGYSYTKEGECGYGPYCRFESFEAYYNLLLKYIEIEKFDEGWYMISNK